MERQFCILITCKDNKPVEPKFLLLMDRRDFLKKAIFGAALASVFPKELLALWNESAFKADTYEKAVQAVYGNQKLIPSDQVTLDVPDTATNSATVPITVTSTLKNAESIALFVEKNKSPLTLQYNLKGKMLPYISTRIKMKETSNVYAVVTVDGKHYVTSKLVNVSAEAC
jgi:sulfur-oxidizing protein SoxY